MVFGASHVDSAHRFEVQPMRVALARAAPALGNIEANLRMHRDAVRKAAAAGAELIVFPGPSPPGRGRTG